jgi:hypothetical protein
MPIRESGASQSTHRLQEEDISLGQPALEDRHSGEDTTLQDDRYDDRRRPEQGEEDESAGEEHWDEERNAASNLAGVSPLDRRGSIHEISGPPHIHFESDPRSHRAPSETSSPLHGAEDVEFAGGWLRTDFGQGRKESDGTIAWSEGWKRMGFASLGAVFTIIVGAGVFCGVADYMG